MAVTGRIVDLTAGDYYRDAVDDRPSLDASIAKILLNESPQHAWHAHPRLNSQYRPSADAKFDVGTVVHRMLLEPERESRVAVVEADSWRSKAAQAVRDQARIEGDTPLLVADYERVMQMLAAVRDRINRLDVDPLPFYAGKAEQTIVWEERGVLCRARLDWLHDGNECISDLKTTRYSANPLKWSQRVLWSIGAHLQTVVYKHAVKAATGIDPELRFVIAETHAPYAISVVSVGPSGLALAEEQWATALDTWRECLENDTWPSYPTRLVEADAPAWLESAWWDAQALDEEVAQ